MDGNAVAIVWRRIFLELRKLQFVVSLLIAVVVTWICWPTTFVAPPEAAALQSSTGTLIFKNGKSDAALSINGEVYFCRYSRANGAYGTACLWKYENASPMTVTATWYWHPKTFGPRKMLISVISSTGDVWLSESSQRASLRLAAMEPGNSPPTLALIFGSVFVALYLFLALWTHAPRN